MPEGPEVLVVADVIKNGIGKVFTAAEVVENVPGKLHRFSNTPIQNFELLQQPWKLSNVRAKGKLIVLEIEVLEIGLSIYAFSTLGMSGSWKWGGRKDKHARLTFHPESGPDLTFEDVRCYGSFRIVTSKSEALQIENRIGWDLLQAPMPNWSSVQSHRKFKNKQIGEILLDQSVFSGIGNIYKAEILYELGIHPEIVVQDLDSKLWEAINTTAHKILQQAYKLGGSSVVDFVADGKEGSAQETHKIYMKSLCPAGHPVKKLEQATRTTHFCPICQLKGK